MINQQPFGYFETCVCVYVSVFGDDDDDNNDDGEEEENDYSVSSTRVRVEL